MATSVRNGVEGKICSSCNLWKSLTEFSPGGRSHGPSQGGKHCWCKECHREAGRVQRARDRAILERAKSLGLSKI